VPKSSKQMFAAAVMFTIALVGSFAATRQIQRVRYLSDTGRNAEVSRPRTEESPYPSGDYLVTYVLLSSTCGICKDKTTQEHLARAVGVIKQNAKSHFAGTSIVAVVIDPDPRAAYMYVRRLVKLGAQFDQISLGGEWLNDNINKLVWQNAAAGAAVPQLLFFRREIDATAFPEVVDVSADSLLLRITGRNELISWVNSGAPLTISAGL